MSLTDSAYNRNRIISILAVLSILLVIGGCTYYDTHIYTRDHLQKISGPLPDDAAYTVYISDRTNTYRLTNPKIDGDSIIGTATILSHTQLKSLNKIYENKDQKIYRINTDTLVTMDSNGHVSLSRNNVTYIQVNERSDVKGIDNHVSIGFTKERQGMALVGFILVVFIICLLFFGLILSVYIDLLSSGCFIATMVYRDHNAEEVLVLRRYRDNVLSKNIFGRLFIQCYYIFSPLFVRLFRNNAAVNSFCRNILDKVVQHLREKEMSGTF